MWGYWKQKSELSWDLHLRLAWKDLPKMAQSGPKMFFLEIFWLTYDIIYVKWTF